MLNAEIKQTNPATVAYLTMHGPYSQIPEGYQRLYEWVARRGLQPLGMPEAIYLTTPDVTPEADAEWELWAPVAGGVPDEAPGDERIGVRSLAPQSVASATHKGPYDSLSATYEDLARWIDENGYAIAGPPHEIYFSDPQEVPPEETITEIQFPVRATS